MTTKGKGKGKSVKSGAQGKTTLAQKSITRTPRTSKKTESAPASPVIKDHSAISDIYRNIPPANYRLQGLRVTVADKGDGTIVRAGKNDSGKYEIVVCVDSDHSEITTRPSDPAVKYYRVGVQKPVKDLYYSDRIFAGKESAQKSEPAKKTTHTTKKTAQKKTTQKTESAPATPEPAKKTTRKGKTARAKFAGTVRATPAGSFEVKSGTVIPATEVTIPMVEPVKSEPVRKITPVKKTTQDDSKFADIKTDSHVPGRTVKNHGKMGLSPAQKVEIELGKGLRAKVESEIAKSKGKSPAKKTTRKTAKTA